ncbi:uncharacterized protein K02A2.6-like [Dermacentor silvarum]|uniref:uncharacterized protein K02A2.6-like n=1 Tax=Dermacentor silvarum TaxID=543639 RepID=UPI00189A002A|nr:uncharacterized protein K02A2.6-like [Dermacentor silvarum]
MKRYWQHRGDVIVCEGLLLKGSRIVVPSALQSRTLELLHDGHQGINRCKALARESVWWPGINNQIDTLVSNWPTCAETRVQCSEPMLPSTTPTRPWEEVGVDIFYLNGQDYGLLVDYWSRFPEVIRLRSTSAPAVINVIKSVLARHGIPRLSNGEVERMVRTVKDLLLKADDLYLALLAYRDTPGVIGVSPAQLLMGRRLHARVPKASHQLEPTWPPSVPSA